MIRSLKTLVRSYGLALDYERSRAKSPSEALTRFLSWLPSEFSRLRQLRFSDYVRLVQLELDCAEAGLGFPRDVMVMGPPWLLPTCFVKLPVGEMPRHSLIDPQYLVKNTETGNGNRHDVVDALRRLLFDDDKPRRWQGLTCITGPDSNLYSSAKIAVCLHLFYPEMWPEINAALDAIPEPFDLYITVPDFICTPQLHLIAASRPDTRFLAGANRGRDVLPFLRLLRFGYFDNYDAVCKLHSKRSPHMQNGEQWRKELLSSLLGNKASVGTIIKEFRSNPRLGMVGPESSCIRPGTKGHRGTNHAWLLTLKRRAGLSDSALQRPFFAGTMFWFKPEALEQLRALPISEKEFPLEMSQTDGTPAHAIERLIWSHVEAAGFFVETAIAPPHFVA